MGDGSRPFAAPLHSEASAAMRWIAHPPSLGGADPLWRLSRPNPSPMPPWPAAGRESSAFVTGWSKMGAEDDRRRRLAAALRDNLKRRKAQDRNRRNSAAEPGDKGTPEAAPQNGAQE